MECLASLPAWLDNGSGYGYGSGYSYGDGSGYGYGDGYGSGYSYGYGSGYSYGDGYGYGYGYGSGSGYGDSSGYGSGYGYGDSSGYGSGYGSGDGSGYGDSSGYGSLSYWRGAAMRALGSAIESSGFLALWRSDSKGKPANNGVSPSIAKAGLVETIEGPLKLCGPQALHATLQPTKWKGERLWVVALHGEVAHSEDKVGALKREILGEIPNCRLGV